MKIIVATEDKRRYWWEMLVQINNFKKRGLDKELTYLVGTVGGKLSTQLQEIKAETGVKIFGYKDRRFKGIAYNPSIRPYVIKKYLFHTYRNNKSDPFMYLDTDVLFLRKLPAMSLTNDVWYLSNTSSYIGSRYIKQKGEELFKEMCEIVDIDPSIVEINDANAGGAQYLIKNTNWEFWEKVEQDSEKLYQHMSQTSNKYNPDHPIQAWTADMWAVLWNAWRDGHQTKTVKTFDFLWATDAKTKYKQNKLMSMYHNAGVTDGGKLFYKGRYVNRAPFADDLSYVDQKFCSAFYVDEINNTKENYPELIKIL